jgi:hypothetical protein
LRLHTYHILTFKSFIFTWALVAQAYTLSSLAGRDKKTHHKKRAGGVAQLVESLPGKHEAHEALSSNPSTEKKKPCKSTVLK